MTTDPMFIVKTKFDAAIPRAAPPPNRPRRRPPLGLRPAPGDNDPASSERDLGAPPDFAPVVNLADYDRAHLDAPAPTALVYEALNGAASMTQTSHQSLKAKIAEARHEIRELNGALVEARHEIRELKLIQESLRISTRGESGRDGARGVPGRDGQRGEIGPAGPAGPRGEAAPRLATWTLDTDRFVATPVMGDGSVAAPLDLMAFFQSYDQATGWADDRDLAEAAQEARKAIEAEAEASRWAK